MRKSIGELLGKHWDRLSTYSSAQRLSKFALVLLSACCSTACTTFRIGYPCRN